MMKKHPAAAGGGFDLFNSVCHHSLFSRPKVTAPPIVAPAVAPVANQGQVAQAQQNQLTALMARSGRQSTILTDNTNKFGG